MLRWLKETAFKTSAMSSPAKNRERKPPILAIGMMSGTSLDGIDASIVYTDGEEIIDLGASTQLPMPSNLKSKLFDLSQKCKDDLAFASKCAYKQLNGGQEGEVRSIELELTALHAEACRSVLDQHEKQLKDNVGYLSRVEKSQRDCLKVTLIGFHGQTIFHHPNTTCDSEEQHGKKVKADNNRAQSNAKVGRFTWQLGDGKYLSKLCQGIKVVSQFRFQDVAAGGGGAPLAPLYHVARLKSWQLSDKIIKKRKRSEDSYAIASSEKPHGGLKPTAIVNIGGVSNVTFVRKDQKPPLAFDCGPGNALIDDWMRLKTNGKQAYDANGDFASKGNVDENIMNTAIFRHGKYLSRMPPKSLDRNEFSTLLEAIVDKKMGLEDGAATLTKFTACCIALSSQFLEVEDIPQRWLICGGGRHNATMMQYLQEELCSNEIFDVDSLGWRGDLVEAECFAFLAVRVLYEKFTSLPTTTSCRDPVCGGMISIAQV